MHEGLANVGPEINAVIYERLAEIDPEICAESVERLAMARSRN
jgi:hypothetical protein